MKLYTEEQVRKMLENTDKFTPLHIDYLIKDITPIELPSDEEIEEFAHAKYMEVEDSRWFEPLQVGAKWMKNKIQGGNNEQQ
jgi:hypothetical protein